MHLVNMVVKDEQVGCILLLVMAHAHVYTHKKFEMGSRGQPQLCRGTLTQQGLWAHYMLPAVWTNHIWIYS